MRIVAQRVSSAAVLVSGITVGEIGNGLLVFLGVSRDDAPEDAEYLLDKLLWLRIFPDENGKMNRNVQEARGSFLIVSQFTLYGDCRRGRRPSFDHAAPPDRARELYEHFLAAARRGPVPVGSGEFQATMEVRLVNDGPVTIWIDSAERRRQ
jgi:D-tyrosyl-tRNA(Tyr) deacylase